jgi:hypothetical protein
MLDAVKRWLSPTPAAAAQAGDRSSIATWAKGRSLQFRGVREGEGFVIDGQLDATAWRLEWGPSQRPYVAGNELRLRADLGLANDVQVLLLDRPLQERLEKTVFEQYVEGVQTRIDTQTPPEMRWLVMFPKLAGADLAFCVSTTSASAATRPSCASGCKALWPRPCRPSRKGRSTPSC